MELSRQEYPALLASLQPGQATTVLNDRIRLINKINADIADWLQERRRLEEAYVQGLRKLARRPQQDNGAALGIFQLPWQRIISATESLAASHETLAQKIEEDVERPLREYSNKNRELQSMPTVQSDLASLAKSLEAAQKKVDKVREKGPKAAEKLAAAISAVEEATQQWESRAPFVFEQLQAIDESRVNHLRDVLTQFQTHEVDQIERNRQTAESCLNVLLNVETADEIKTFAAKVNGGRPPPVFRRQDSSSAGTTPLPPPPRIHDDAASQRSGRSGHERTPPPVPEPRHTPLGGLRRLGTVMNRRKSIVQNPSGVGLTSPDKKHRAAFAPFRRGDPRDMPLPEGPPSTSGHDSVVQDPISPQSESARGPSESHVREDSETVAPIPETQPVPVTNGTSSVHHGPEIGQADMHSPPQDRVDSEGFSERPETIDEITRVQREAAGLAGMDEHALNLTIRDKPIQEDESEAKQAMDEMANTLRLQAQQSGVGVRRNVGTLRGRRDVRNTIFVPNPPLPGKEPSVPGLNPIPDVPLPSSSLLQNRRPVSPNAAEDHALSDTTSIHSSHTLHSLSGPATHPDLHEPGLNASIIETVSAWFSEGNVTKSSVFGELALAYNPVGEFPSRSDLIRLDNFPVLEKVAANPHFVIEAGDSGTGEDDQRGHYNIALSSISRSIPTVAFKYQVHIDASNISSYCPIIFNPAWNLEEFQASVIVAYSVNPSFTSTVPVTSITLRNLVLTVGLDISPEDEVTKQPREVVRATGAAMYPSTGATFRRKHSAVVWKIPEFEVKAGESGKFLARFTTTTSWPRKGKVEARFEHRTVDTGSKLGISVASADEPKESNPFADEIPGAPTKPSLNWREVPTVRKLVTGKYVSS
ncbi:hypothetical protein VTN02DRAFT_6586 [Thermoascus thermophilus]